MKRWCVPRLALILLLAACWVAACSPWAPRSDHAAAHYAGSGACAACHASEAGAWAGSHHALAMQPASESSVLGDFRNVRVFDAGDSARFFRRGHGFWARLAGRGGAAHEYPILYTFGVQPLQQYLVALPRGRLQALRFAWDSRPGERGGQRWFALYPGQRIPPGDPLHWSGRNQNWNFMCARCHSTNLMANYDAASDSFTTRWSEIHVACEACHGPGSRHIEWARRGGARRAQATADAGSHAAAAGPAGGTPPGSAAASVHDEGLIVDLQTKAGLWALADTARGIAAWSGAPRGDVVLETCAPCHSRAREIAPHQPGSPFLDSFAPVTLEPGLYFADGQIEGEVYEYGSFRQSRMYAAGVTCTDCHDPHSLSLRASGNALCTRCHLAARFESQGHHHHRAGTRGAQCVSCHMPTRTYMAVDERRDHSLRVPRPDLTARIGVPNPCAACHRDRPASWAAAAIARWRPGSKPPEHFATVFDSARRELPRSDVALAGVASDDRVPAIARATALAMLAALPGRAATASAMAHLADSDALLRSQAVALLDLLAPNARVVLAAPLLSDSVRAVRIEAARVLAEAARTVPAADSAAFRRALAELVAAERMHLERPESHVNLATLAADLGRPAEAERELMAALALDSLDVPAMVNLADLMRSTSREAEGEAWLLRAMHTDPRAAEPVYALALHRVRAGDHRGALELLRRAAAMDPARARYAYAYGVALHSEGQADRAIAVLSEAQRRHPSDREILTALAAIERDLGRMAAADGWARKLEDLDRP